jgi:hypothetical protein
VRVLHVASIALAVVATATAAACGSPTDASDGGAAESTTAVNVGLCDSALVTGAMEDVVAAARAELTEGSSKNRTVFSCKWTADDGAEVSLKVTPVTSGGVSEDLLASLGMTPIDDGRFGALDMLPVEVLACDGSSTAGFSGCTVTAYGPEHDVSVQVRSAGDVTRAAVVDAVWAVADGLFG